MGLFESIIYYKDFRISLSKCTLLLTCLGGSQGRDITLPTKAHRVKAMVFPAIMYTCESWTIKKSECQRTDPFELQCWRTLKNPLDFKEIKPVNPKAYQS